MVKKNPVYKLTVYNSDEEVLAVVESPITCKFTCNRGLNSKGNKANIQLYNLSPSTRNVIFQDIFIAANKKNWKYISFEAGYDSNGYLPLIFWGRIMQAYSYKSGGQTDIITQIEATPAAIFDSDGSYTFVAGTHFKDSFLSIASTLAGIKVGNIGNLNGTFKTQTTFDGNSFDAINTLTGGHSYVDNKTLNTLMDNECLDVPVPIITDSSGLLDTPIRKGGQLEIKTLFEPSLLVGQLLEIKSATAPIYNGQFKVIGFTHDCLFSETQAGQRITTVNLLIGGLLPNSNIALTGEQVTTGSNQNQFLKVKGEEITPVAINAPEDVHGVYNYIKANNGVIPNTKITNNISWKEMLGNNNTNSERMSELTIEILTNVYNTAQTLQKFIDTHYFGRKINITSGWRSSINNTKCGGKPTSKHLTGLAVDFYISGVPIANLFSVLRSFWDGYIQEYRSQGFVHAQLNQGKGRVNDV